MKITFISGALALILGSQITPAKAQVRNTYNGAECASILPAQANRLNRAHGIRAISAVEVVCPIVKAIFNSTAGVVVAVTASSGTSCRLQSFDVFTNGSVASAVRTFPPGGVSGLDFTIGSSLRGAMQLRCTLPAGAVLRNYLVLEQ
jgi:hypothetical protein